jgi:hypothetical protein
LLHPTSAFAIGMDAKNIENVRTVMMTIRYAFFLVCIFFHFLNFLKAKYVMLMYLTLFSICQAQGEHPRRGEPIRGNGRNVDRQHRKSSMKNETRKNSATET